MPKKLASGCSLRGSFLLFDPMRAKRHTSRRARSLRVGHAGKVVFHSQCIGYPLPLFFFIGYTKTRAQPHRAPCWRGRKRTWACEDLNSLDYFFLLAYCGGRLSVNRLLIVIGDCFLSLRVAARGPFSILQFSCPPLKEIVAGFDIPGHLLTSPACAVDLHGALTTFS